MAKAAKTNDDDGVTATSPETSELTSEEVGRLCANATAKYDRPNINSRTMLLMPEFWTEIVRSIRGEVAPPAEGTAPPVVPPIPPEVPSAATDNAA